LQRNALLVINERGASFGILDGRLPGVPVQVEVEPPLTIRELPSSVNGWKQLMLYSGTERLSSITIRWTEVR
jgi:hypothetical protein